MYILYTKLAATITVNNEGKSAFLQTQ